MTVQGSRFACQDIVIFQSFGRGSCRSPAMLVSSAPESLPIAASGSSSQLASTMVCAFLGLDSLSDRQKGHGWSCFRMVLTSSLISHMFFHRLPSPAGLLGVA